MPKNTWVEGLVSKAGLWLLLYRYFGICTWYTRFGNAMVSRHDMVKGFHTALFNWSSNVTIPMVCPRASIGVYLTMLSVYFYLGLTFAFLPLAVDPLFFSTPGFLARNFHVHWRVFLEPAVKYLRQLLRSERLRPANVHVHLCIHLSLNFVSYIVPIFSLVPVMFSHIYKNYPVFFFDEKIIGTYANLWGRACVKLAGT